MQIDDALFLVIGTLFSLFYGIRSYFIFSLRTLDKKDREAYEKSISLKVHNFFVNFTGSAIGWICLYLLYKDLFSSGLKNFDPQKIGLGHLFLVLIAFLGIWGILPLTFWGLASSAKYMAEKALGRLK